MRTGSVQDMIKIALGFAAVYALICIGVYFSNRVLMYFPDPSRVPPGEAGLAGVEEVELAADDSVTLVAWHAPARDGKNTILYFHGNASNAANRARKIEMMREDGSGVLYLNNRSYGGSGGRPTEANNVADAIAAYDHLVERGVPPERIVTFGKRSALARRCGSRASGPLRPSCSKRHSPRRSTWRGRPLAAAQASHHGQLR